MPRAVARRASRPLVAGRSLVCLAVSFVVFGCVKKHKPEPMTEVWLGERHAFGRLKKGGLASWGDGTTGALGTGVFAVRPLPALTLTTDLPRALALGARHTCGIFEGDGVRCWGDGGRGQLGDGSIEAHAVARPSEARPVAGPDGKPLRARAIWARGDRTCVAAKPTNAAICWGAGRGAPFEHAALKGASVASVAFDDAGLCASLDAPLEVRCTSSWTDDVDPAKGDVTTHLSNVEVTELVGGGGHRCALGSGHALHCWGKNDHGQLGDGSFRDAPEPVPVTGIEEVVEVAAGDRFTCARTSRSVVACWGDNASYQLVSGTTEPRPSPSLVPGLIGVVQLVAAKDSACARLGDGGVRCWGKNDDGQLGDGTRQDHPVPMPVKW